ncbi:hypothetical protein ABTI17_19685, partial [Acinetobacter baumannii]
MGGLDPARLKALLETPQPHLIDHSHDGQPFLFEAPDPFADPNEIIANQIHPGGNDAPIEFQVQMERSTDFSNPSPL